MSPEDRAAFFETHRSALVGLAYRMLGSHADAHDLAQDTYLKWREVDVHGIRDPRAWLMTVCSRLALNRMHSARARRETYVGTWLPEPLLPDETVSPAERTQIDDTVSVALMLALEKLTPLERAAFILHEIFGIDFDEIGKALDRTPAATRKLASRARAALQVERPRFSATSEEHRRLLDAFLGAARGGDLAGLRIVLAEAVALHADGGGKAVTIPRVLHGAHAVGTFFVAVFARHRADDHPLRFVPHWFNGTPGILIYEGARLITALSLGVADGMIHNIYAHRNPDKLEVFTAGDRN